MTRCQVHRAQTLCDDAGVECEAQRQAGTCYSLIAEWDWGAAEYYSFATFARDFGAETGMEATDDDAQV